MDFRESQNINFKLTKKKCATTEFEPNRRQNDLGLLHIPLENISSEQIYKKDAIFGHLPSPC